MNSPSKPAGKLSARELALLSLMAAVMFGSKLVLAAVPNVHLNALLIILTTLCFGWRALYTVGAYVLLEGLVYGFGLWWISYVYAWPLLCLATMLLRRNEGSLFWAIIAGGHGLCFGALCALPYIFISGFPSAVAYWIAGIPFDLIHCAGNFAVTLILLKPLLRVMEKMIKNPGGA